MSTKCFRFAGVLAACFVMLAGCASTPKPRDEFTCTNAKDCRAKVYVSCWLNYWPCQVSVDPYRLVANGNNVFWDLQDEGDGKRFKFDPDTGIEFKKSGNGFKCMQVAGGRSFKCDNGKQAGEHEYGVKVIGDVWVPRLDPWVVN